MCGIVGYVGSEPAVRVILEGLRAMEYRGYDSIGIGIIDSRNELSVYRSASRLSDFERRFAQAFSYEAQLCIGHTRWATHGAPTEANTHPHVDAANKIALVHNGIIENYAFLKHGLVAKGYRFKSQTDSEVLAVLIGDIYDRRKKCARRHEPVSLLQMAVDEAREQIKGEYSIAVISQDEPNTIVAAQSGQSMYVAMLDNSFLLSSELSVFHQPDDLSLTYLGDGTSIAVRPV